MRFCYYLLHFSKVGGLRKGHFLGHHFGDHMGDKIVEIGVQMSSKKSSENRHPNFSDFGVHFWDPWAPLGHPLERN